MSRIEILFKELKSTRTALVGFVTAGDPDYAKSLKIAETLLENGTDILELGMPFTDPMADGPVIQASSLRALNHGQTMLKTLQLVHAIRLKNQTAPIVLMGYYNPIYIYGVEKFIQDALAAGVDGLIVVDLPPEHDDELCIPAKKHGIDFIRLLTPTTVGSRLDKLLKDASGFVYYVSVTGVTGTKTPNIAEIEQKIELIRTKTTLPICVGFGIKTQAQVATIGAFADGVVVGSALVSLIDADKDIKELSTEIAQLTRSLAQVLPVKIDDYMYTI